MKIARRKKPPPHLSAEARGLWKALTVEYGIVDAGGVVILCAGLEAFDRMRQAQPWRAWPRGIPKNPH